MFARIRSVYIHSHTVDDVLDPVPEQFYSSSSTHSSSVLKVPIIWSQKMVAGVRHGNSLVVRRVSPGRINVVLLI